MNTRRAAIVVLTLLALAAPMLAGEHSFSGVTAIEFRGFVDEPQFVGQQEGVQTSWIFSPEYRYQSGNRRNFFTVIPFWRVDAVDSERTHFDVREAYWRHVGRDWEVLVGANRVFWGVTESRHLVDVVNQADFVEDPDEEDKLGQPMISVAWQRSWGRLEAFALFGFRERTFPGGNGRFRAPIPIDTDAALFESGAGNRRIDTAFRYSHYFGNWDVGLHLFQGTGREPVFLPATEKAPRLVPYYQVTRQAGADVQYTRNAWLWKVETMVRQGQGTTFAAMVGGFEYTLYQVGGGAADVGILAEYLYDGRDRTAPFTAFDNDVFVGSRVALNDAQDTSVLFGVIVDANDGSIAGRLEAERRLSQRFLLEVESRFFTNVAPGNALNLFREDSYLGVRVGYHF